MIPGSGNHLVDAQEEHDNKNKTIMPEEYIMANPGKAYEYTRCSVCDEKIGEGNPVYFHESERYCSDCAEDSNIVCDCGDYKKPQYESCYNCK